MGNSKSKPDEKFNKNHITKKGFQFGVSFGKEDLTMEGNIQIGWTNKTVKNYSCVPKISSEPCLGEPSTTRESHKINDDEIFELDSTDQTKKGGQAKSDLEKKLDFKREKEVEKEER